MSENGWKSTSVAEIVDPKRPVTYGIVQPGAWQEPENGVALIRGQDYSGGSVRVENLKYVHPTIASAYQRSTVSGGDILLSIVGYVGQCAIVPDHLVDANITQTTARIATSDKYDSKYFLHYFRSNRFKEEVSRFTKGSAQPGLNLADVDKMEVRFPCSKEEQSAIANILDTLDTQIRQTEAIIAKLQQVKQGLLHDLLTRGIDANGQLRPPREQAPALYKKSPLGWIPREWEAVPLGNMLDSIEGGWSPNCPESQPSVGEWGVLKVSAVTSGFYKDYEAKALPPSLKPKPSLEVKKGDVILTRANGNPDLVAKTVMVTFTQGKLMLSDKILRLVPESTLLPPFLNYIMDFYKTKHQVAALISGSSGQKNISQKQIRSLIVPQLPVGEQESAVEKVDLINARIIRESLALSKLKLQKSGLMDDLLTGRVRVNPGGLLAPIG